MPSRLNRKTIAADVAAQSAIEAMTDFNPSNDDYKAANLDALKQAMLTKQAAETVAAAAAASARDEATTAEHDYHDAVTGAKTAVKAQYGKDSNQVQAVGLKKSNEIRRGRRPALAKNS